MRYFDIICDVIQLLLLIILNKLVDTNCFWYHHGCVYCYADLDPLGRHALWPAVWPNAGPATTLRVDVHVCPEGCTYTCGGDPNFKCFKNWSKFVKNGFGNMVYESNVSVYTHLVYMCMCCAVYVHHGLGSWWLRCTCIQSKLFTVTMCVLLVWTALPASTTPVFSGWKEESQSVQVRGLAYLLSSWQLWQPVNQLKSIDAS